MVKNVLRWEDYSTIIPWYLNIITSFLTRGSLTTEEAEGAVDKREEGDVMGGRSHEQVASRR